MRARVHVKKESGKVSLSLYNLQGSTSQNKYATLIVPKGSFLYFFHLHNLHELYQTVVNECTPAFWYISFSTSF